LAFAEAVFLCAYFPLAAIIIFTKIQLMARIFFALLILLSSVSCQTEAKKVPVDLLVVAKQIYLKAGETAQAMVIKEGKVWATGSQKELESAYKPQATKIFEGMYIYPGFNDAHAHFLGYARSLGRVNLVATQSWQECLERLQNFAEKNPNDFLLGRGWDQNDWESKEFPDRRALDSLYPHTPVLLKRIDGHAAIANQAALDYAGINASTKLAGGTIDLAKGILIDNAVDLIEEPENDPERDKELILKAQEFCLHAGLTSITDAGLKKKDIQVLQDLSESGELKLRLNVMVSDDSASLAYYFARGPMEEPRFRLKTVKFYLDGALGSRGALLLNSYADDPGNYGLQLKPTNYFLEMADSLSHQKWQMAIHAIGDSANRLATQIFGVGYLHNRNHRWRIEHAQVVHPQDLEDMKALGVIPSIQPTHATSDMYWAEERLGPDAVQYAYRAQSFLDQELVLPLGTDFPVEDINPLNTFRAARFRVDANAYPEGGFRAEEALSFDEALKGMTWSGAYASFEEEVKGLLERGYYADFIVMDRDLKKLKADEFSNLEVKATAINGEFLYSL